MFVLALAPYGMVHYVIIGIVVLGFGCLLFRKVRHNGGPRRWTLPVAFVSGPVVTLLWCLFDAFQSNDYRHPGYVEEVVFPMLVVGLICGSAGAIAFWLAESVFAKKS